MDKIPNMYVFEPNYPNSIYIGYRDSSNLSIIDSYKKKSWETETTSQEIFLLYRYD